MSMQPSADIVVIRRATRRDNVPSQVHRSCVFILEKKPQSSAMTKRQNTSMVFFFHKIVRTAQL